tara:strand:- start:1 stop:570 length:570 start_codon:yes stop_codon:yes gene_type:complete
MEENTVRTIENNTLLKKYLIQSKLLFGVELYPRKHISNKNKIDLILVTELPNHSSIEEKPIDWRYEKLLNNIIQSIGKKLNHDVLLVTIFKQRPDFIRTPLRDEVLDFEKRLSEVVNFSKPKLILALGKIVGKSLLKKDLPIEKMRNLTYNFHNVPLRVTYDINNILNNSDYKKPTWIDFQWVRDFLIN